MKQVAKRVLVAAVTTAGLTFAIPAAPASAANVTSCGDPTLPPRTDLAWVETSTGNRMCFANAGSLRVSFNDVRHFHSGNNTVRFSYIIEENNYATERTLSKWQDYTIDWGLHARVYNVLICGGPVECPVK
ncbi:beta/gamma crystallin domain-containing protein [Streptomyces sp. NPDC051740]|uniref:beta/gamma crystallin domain-containing protein n=1 Tax=Streptomyces sp. NPDC051740 TaxID=3365673 RepID=UPI0037B7741C